MKFDTHVYAVVAIKVANTSFEDDPALIAKDVGEAVSKAPGEWMRPVLGSLNIDHAGNFNIESVEFADQVNWTVVDEMDERGDLRLVHHFDVTGEPMAGMCGFNTAREARLSAEVDRLTRLVEAQNCSCHAAQASGPAKQSPAQSSAPIDPLLMRKDVSASELATVVYNLLTEPERCGEFGSQESYLRFVTAAAQLVAEHCGGEVSKPAEETPAGYSVEIHGNDSLPEGSEGVWQTVGKHVLKG